MNPIGSPHQQLHLSASRRRFLWQMSAGLAFFTVPGAFAEALVRTPRQTEGPFYPDPLPLDTDNDLIVINNSLTPATGDITWLSGRILDAKGDPIRNATVEIWQCDAKGVYQHTADRDRASRDTNFQGFGRFLTSSTGEYLFRTIKPVAYPGRTPHIHVRIQPERGSSLATQLYLPDAPGNVRDFLFSRMSPDEQQALLLKLEPSRDAVHPLAHSTRLTASTQLVLG